MSKHKLDLWKQVLPAMDRHDMGFYDKLDEDEKKSFAGVVAMRALSATRGQHADWYLIAVNERANRHFFDIYEHPELQYRLLASNGVGRSQAHEWIGGAKKQNENALDEFILRFWPRANKMEIDLVLSQFDRASFSQFVDGTGISADDAKRIKKIFQDRQSHGV